MTHYRKRLGEQGEAIARQHLEASGYRILAQNWRTPAGEIDLVAETGGTLVFVEVKARTSHDFGRPEEAVTHRKRQKLIHTARTYLQRTRNAQAAWRIDVIAVDVDSDGNPLHLEHYQDVIQEG